MTQLFGEITVGTSEHVIAEKKRINVFPVPTQEILTFKCNTEDWGAYDLYLFNAAGKEVHRFMHVNTPEFTLSIPDLIPGIYFYRAIQKNNIHSGKIIVSR
jgi:hypothetical protein